MNKTKHKKSISEEDKEKRGVIITLAAIVVVLGLILTYIFVFNKKEEKVDEEPITVPVEVEEDTEEVVRKVTSQVVSNLTYYKVVYLDSELNQIGQTQKVVDVKDRVDENAPKLSGYRFSKWAEVYDEKENTYYYVALYVQNVERIPLEEEPYLDEERGETEGTYVASINETVPLEEEEFEGPTYDVNIEGEIEELDPEDVSEEVTINTEEFSHIIALKFNAPNEVTKEDIEKMWIKVSSAQEEVELEGDQYYYKGEDVTLSGRELLDSTDEEYDKGEFYFYYYQEADTKTDVVIEVYWGNDDEADSEALPPIEPRTEYVETYNIKFEESELE